MAGILDAFGFDVYDTADLLTRFTSKVEASGATVTIATGGRNGTNCLNLVNNGSNNSSRGSALLTIGTQTTIYVGFGFTINAHPPATNFSVFFTFLDASSHQGFFAIRPDGTIGYYRGPANSGSHTLLGATSFVVQINTYYHFAAKLVFSNTVGVVETKINNVGGASQLTLSSQDTVHTANASISQVAPEVSSVIGLAVPNAFTVKYDDFVIRDDAFVVDSRVRESLPISVGDVDNGVPTGAADSEAATDESPADEDTTYTSLTTVGHKILLNYDDIPSNSTVIAVMNLPYAKKSDAGTAAFKSLNKVGGTEYLSSNEKAPSDSSYAYFPDVHMVSPATAVAWTAAEVNGAQHGVQRSQ